MSRKLYEISSELRAAIARLVDQETGEVSDEGVAELQALEMERAAKLEGCVLAHRELLGRAEEIGKEAKVLAAMKARKVREAERLERYILGEMEVGEKIDGRLLPIRCKASYRVDVDLSVFEERGTIAKLPAEMRERVPPQKAGWKLLKAGVQRWANANPGKKLPKGLSIETCKNLSVG